jgi:hypothetical protein
MLSTDSLVRELFLVCQLAIGYQLAKNQLASNRPIGNWCQLASNWPIGLDWQLAGRARFFWIGLAIGWPTKNYLSNWATLPSQHKTFFFNIQGSRLRCNSNFILVQEHVWDAVLYRELAAGFGAHELAFDHFNFKKSVVNCFQDVFVVFILVWAFFWQLAFMAQPRHCLLESLVLDSAEHSSDEIGVEFLLDNSDSFGLDEEREASRNAFDVALHHVVR